MPPKKQASEKSPKKQTEAKKYVDPESPEAFERELKNLATQAQSETWLKWIIEQFLVYTRAVLLLTLTGLYSTVSKAALSPVYGDIPTSIYHTKVIMVAAFAGWSMNLMFRRHLPVKTQKLIPLVAAYIPMVQFYLFKLSGVFTAKWGPMVTEALTLFPVVVFCVASTADILEQADLDGLPKWAADAAPGFWSYGVFTFVAMFSEGNLQMIIGKSWATSRMGLEMVLAGIATIIAPSKLLLYTIPALLHTAILNTHVMTPTATQALNSTLRGYGWTLIDRRESVTGYISVMDSDKDGFRVMRCDHSLLGGEWTNFAKPIVAEPIYSIFTMLENVRLVEVEGQVPDKKARALNIGLGIGTTPGALIAHGIDTTIVEIDPVVYDFAVKYFNLNKKHTAVMEDAVKYTARATKDEHERFDYIIHDVFTGGAEPIPLFTLEFLQSLHTLLKPNGVIAINYAGDFMLPPLSTVARTVRSVFPSCRIFRESEAPSEDTKFLEGRDFDNVVIFCRKTNDKITFRNAVVGDFLQSRAREVYMYPRYEVFDSAFLTGEDVGIVSVNDTEKLANWHPQTGLGHWAVMRTVVPKEIWENW